RREHARALRHPRALVRWSDAGAGIGDTRCGIRAVAHFAGSGVLIVSAARGERGTTAISRIRRISCFPFAAVRSFRGRTIFVRLHDVAEMARNAKCRAGYSYDACALATNGHLELLDALRLIRGLTFTRHA